LTQKQSNFPNQMSQKYTVSSRREGYLLITTYRGDPKSVVQVVSSTIRNQDVVKCYEHMLTHVGNVNILENNQLEIITYTNEYAGD